ncbi:hypothetical protein ABK040_005734 [Willaertia magna]
MCGRAHLSIAPATYRDRVSHQIGADMYQTVWVNQALFQPSYNMGPFAKLPIIYYDPENKHQKTDLTTVTQDNNIKKEELDDSIQVKQEMKTEIKVKTEVKTEVKEENYKIEGLVIQTMSWGLIPSFSTKEDHNPANMINARVETITDKKVFNRLLKNQRGIVFVEGFYEWKELNFKKKQAVYIHPKEKNELLCFACLFDKKKENENEYKYTFTIITTDASKDFSNIHDRMPAILNNMEDIKKWLGITPTSGLTELLKVLQPLKNVKECLDIYEVSDFVNSIANQSSKCIKKLSEIQRGKGSLHQFFKPLIKMEEINNNSQEKDTAKQDDSKKRIKKEEEQVTVNNSKKVKQEPIDE